MAEAFCRRSRAPRPGRSLELFFSVLAFTSMLSHPSHSFFSLQAEKPARQVLTTLQAGSSSGQSKTVLILSDASGRTASTLLAGVLAQFQIRDTIEVQMATEVTSKEKLQAVIDGVKNQGSDVLVLATLVDSTMAGWAKSFCADCNMHYVEVMGPLLDRFGGFLEETSQGKPGASISERSIKRILNKDFFGMVEAMKYLQRHIGGLNSQDWDEADIILVGPSRCGKGPVAHQLAMRGLKAAALNISPYDTLPPELFTVEPHKVALITVEEERLLRLRQSRKNEMTARNMPMLLEDDYTSPERVRQDLELTKELQQQNSHWPGAVDMTYLSPEESASLLIRQVKQGKAAMRLSAK